MSCVRAVWSLTRGLPPSFPCGRHILTLCPGLSYVAGCIKLDPDPVTWIPGLTSDLPHLCGLVWQSLDWGWLVTVPEPALLSCLGTVGLCSCWQGSGKAASEICRLPLACTNKIKPLQHPMPQCTFEMHQRVKCLIWNTNHVLSTKPRSFANISLALQGSKPT